MPSAPLGASASACSTSACLRLAPSCGRSRARRRTPCGACSMVVRAARKRFQSSLASFLGRRGPSCWWVCQRAKSVVELGRDLLPLRLRGIGGGEGLSASTTSAVRSATRLGERGLRLGALLLGELGDGAAEGFDAACGSGEVADGVRRADRLLESVDGLRDVGRGCAALDALLEQGHLAGELGVLALEVGRGPLRGWRRGTGRLRVRRRPRARRPCPSRRRDPTRSALV